MDEHSSWRVEARSAVEHWKPVKTKYTTGTIPVVQVVCDLGNRPILRPIYNYTEEPEKACNSGTPGIFQEKGFMPAGSSRYVYIYILHVYMVWSLDWTKSIQTSRNVMCIQDNAGILLVFIGMLLVSSWFSWWLIAAAFLLCLVTLGNEMETTWHLATLTWAGARTRTAWQSCREICWSWSALLASNIW